MIRSARQASSRWAASVILLSLLTPIAWVYWLQPLLSYLNNHPTYPTGIPWVQSEVECLDSGRIWQNEICWDRDHDANF